VPEPERYRRLFVFLCELLETFLGDDVHGSKAEYRYLR
jgi:hypothetical protein